MLLEREYCGYGSPVPHRGCKYNTENFYKSLVVLESESPYIKNKKLIEQARLMGYDYLAQQKRYEVPKSWTNHTFNSGK